MKKQKNFKYKIKTFSDLAEYLNKQYQDPTVKDKAKSEKDGKKDKKLDR